MTDESSPPEDAAAPLPPKSEAKTTQRFLKARQAQKSGPERPGSTGDVRDMYALRLREPPAARRSLFRRLLITTLAVLATYGALTQLLAYRLGAQVLSDTFQQQLVDPTVTSLEDVLGNMLGSEPPQEPIQTYLDRRFGGMRRLTVAVYTPEGDLIAQAVGVPGSAPDKLEAYAQQKVSEGARYRQSRDLGFVAVGPIRRGPPPTAGSSPLLGFVRVAG
ncbi:MAG TPA: hypothetical protein DIU15_09015, partial [Deltaproteobacteria bacterium]|nr:hypothetical protein [Deltaproteobacteria bacterium]